MIRPNLRANCRVPKLSRHASGQAVVRLCGKDHYVGPFGSAEAQAKYDALIAEWLSRGRVLAPSDAAELSVNELALSSNSGSTGCRSSDRIGLNANNEMSRLKEPTMAGSRTRLTKSKARRGMLARPAARLGRAKAWEQLEGLWETATVSVPRDRLTRDQRHERR